MRFRRWDVVSEREREGKGSNTAAGGTAFLTSARRMGAERFHESVRASGDKMQSQRSNVGRAERACRKSAAPADLTPRDR